MIKYDKLCLGDDIMEFIDSNIFSIDKSRYYIKNEKLDDKIFCKKSTYDEYKSLLFARQILLSYPELKINGEKYRIHTPNIYSFKDNIIEMQYFNGQNLELLLRNHGTHLMGVNFLNDILMFLIKNGFNWIDFAPRNILLNGNDICLVDFEKKLSNSIDDKVRYLQNHVYEEYSSFVFESERLFSINDVFSFEKLNNTQINIETIKIKRCKYLCYMLYNKSQVSDLEYYTAWKMILKAEIPFILDNDMIFPRLYLSKILNNKEYSNESYYKYAEKILEVNKCINPQEKIKLLKNR